MLARDHKGRRLSVRSVELGYDPLDDRCVSRFCRPPKDPACVIDYFFAIRKKAEFLVAEMRKLMEDPDEFFDDNGMLWEDWIYTPEERLLRIEAMGNRLRSPSQETPMMERGRAIVFDVDEETLASLRQAFSEWQVEVSDRATIDLLIGGHSLGVVDLLVLGVGADVAKGLGLCRVLRKHLGSAHTPILMLVEPGEDSLVRAALEAGATSCLVLPVHAKELASMVTRAQEGNQPGRHTLNLDRAQVEDSWRDEGGQG